LRSAARRAAASGYSGLGIEIAGAAEPRQLRTFVASPRDEGELVVGANWLSERFAARVKITGVADPDDDQDVRFDGSYVGVNVGNFMISAGYLERWWGPGWDGSLILGSNARPIPSVTVERNYTDAFKSRWLSWIGPWRASLAVGQLEGSRVAVPDAKFFAARINFKPRPWLEVGLSRSAQFCGQGQPCGWDVYQDLLIGQSNLDDPLRRDPGNQLAGYDLRIRSPWKRLPLTFYGQMIGEDAAGALPSKFMGLFGLETWGHSGLGSWRAHLEFSDNTCTFSRQNPQFNCAYRSGQYPQGYLFRGRGIGHTLDSDSRMLSVGALLVRPAGETWAVALRRADLNRGGAADAVHAWSPVPADLTNVDLDYSRSFAWGRLQVGLSFDDNESPSADGSQARGFVSWRRDF
jgi:hypothetical protein